MIITESILGLVTVYRIDSRFTQQCNVVFYVYENLCSLLAAASQFSILIGQNMQLTGCHNGNEMRNTTYADTQISFEWPYCSFPILWFGCLVLFNDFFPYLNHFTVQLNPGMLDHINRTLIIVNFFVRSMKMIYSEKDFGNIRQLKILHLVLRYAPQALQGLLLLETLLRSLVQRD